MMGAVPAVIKRILASSRLSFIITAIIVLCAASPKDAAAVLSNGNYTWLPAVMVPFFTVYYDYAKLMHLGTSKRDYFIASLVSYGILSLLISLVNTGIHLWIDPLGGPGRVINLMELCGWMENGPAAALLQQAAFLLWAMLFLHVLLSMQPCWYGWLADGLLAAIVCIFTPIGPLRRILAGFFKLVMFNPNAPLHLGVCLLLCAALSLAGLAVLKRKAL